MEKITLKQLQGPVGRPHLIDALMVQRLIVDEGLAVEIVRLVKLEEISAGTNLIKQGAFDTDLFFILSGEFSVAIGGCVVARRKAGEQVGEMAVVDPHIPRSASVTAICDSVVARITEADFSALAERFPRLWRRIALELVTLLRNGNTADRDRGLLQPMKYQEAVVCSSGSRLRAFTIAERVSPRRAPESSAATLFYHSAIA